MNPSPCFLTFAFSSSRKQASPARGEVNGNTVIVDKDDNVENDVYPYGAPIGGGFYNLVDQPDVPLVTKEGENQQEDLLKYNGDIPNDFENMRNHARGGE